MPGVELKHCVCGEIPVLQHFSCLAHEFIFVECQKCGRHTKIFIVEDKNTRGNIGLVWNNDDVEERNKVSLNPCPKCGHHPPQICIDPIMEYIRPEVLEDLDVPAPNKTRTLDGLVPVMKTINSYVRCPKCGHGENVIINQNDSVLLGIVKWNIESNYYKTMKMGIFADK